MNTENHSQTAAFIWSVADLLRGDFKQSQYGRVILPFTLLRRLECVLAPTREKVLAEAKASIDKTEAVRERLLLRAAGKDFFNASPLTLATLSDTQTADDLMSYVQSFSQAAREIFEHFHFEDFVQQLAGANLLYQVVQRFASIDLNPARISNFGMGIIFEELIRKFAESSNETAGEHFTPRDIVHLTTSLVLTGQEHKLKPSSIITIYDPTAGTGGFLSEGDEFIQQVSTGVTVSLHGQELNPESYAICKADMLIKGQGVDNIKLGNTLSDDQLPTLRADFMLANPPFGVEWKKVQKDVVKEHEQRGFDGRFGPGLPRVSDGSLLFLLHLVSKMQDPKQGGSRIGIILNGSPLFTGGAGSGESEIRRYLLQSDLVEAIVALPTDMFYNTGIATYVWVLSNNKPAERRGKVQLINATSRYSKMRKSLGSKRQYVDDANSEAIVRAYGAFEETEESKIFPVEAFGYRRITVERPLQLNFQASSERLARLDDEKPLQKLEPAQFEALMAACGTLDPEKIYQSRLTFTKALKAALKPLTFKLGAPQLKAVLSALSERDPDAEVCTDKDGNPEADSSLRDNENVPMGESIHEYFEREVKPHVPEAWIDESKRDPLDGGIGIVGFEIPFNRHFYKFVPPRPLEEIDADLKACTDRIKAMIEELSA
ncbi:class I SAM-dependent DNA methyltransferase [Haliea sp.]|uniref:type I restriction-modification system subunit M n=1 Tax=Haliea TaxID=475794 RepID=UPI000C3D2372|nr:class I SAM-dependent DNA methyltransferase [Haliea sp.]HCD56555.1 restriction endonuclease subunit M [Halieaceae bacterium]MAD65175.1 restriction endonuclease subunit M [Haliea sp.]MAY92937.1 restriction endonuclease subunit M [Haliea sp.]MBK40424.1 restriction endonuclease subunit M [Haliea sp.]MBP68825.1 restriction endonuclease subunit M [Haliea sp.]